MRTASVLVTGANGEIGHGLITRLTGTGCSIVTVDITPLEPSLRRLVRREFTGSVTDVGLLERILAEFDVDRVFHRAALRSTRVEFTSVTAQMVNVDGSLNLLEFAHHESESHGRPVVFLYPSSIAAYGLPGLDTKMRARRVREDEWNMPATMHGCNKLYCEHLGRYCACHYKQLAADMTAGRVDFRCVRLPGLISAVTVPSGGTSDYAAVVIHAGVRGEAYGCFVRPDTRIPLMTMPDVVETLLLASVPRERLSRTAYNVSAFSQAAEDIGRVVTKAFPSAAIGWDIDPKRQRIIDSWPAEVDDSAARQDWGFAPRYDFTRAFDEYLIPTVRERP